MYLNTKPTPPLLFPMNIKNCSHIDEVVCTYANHYFFYKTANATEVLDAKDAGGGEKAV